MLVPRIEQNSPKEWTTFRWNLWSKTESVYEVDVLEINVSLRTGMAMAEENAASGKDRAESGQNGSPP